MTLRFRLRLVSASLLVASLAISIGASRRPAAQTTSCDPLLEQPKTNPYGYRLRTDRCEGIYVQQVAGATLLVASFTEVFEDPAQRLVRVDRPCATVVQQRPGRPSPENWDSPWWRSHAPARSIQPTGP